MAKKKDKKKKDELKKKGVKAKATKASKPKESKPKESKPKESKVKKVKLPELATKKSSVEFFEIAPGKIHVVKGFNPRETLGSLKELTENIKANGVIENLVVRQVGDDYKLICGHRRLKAAKDAGLKKVPVTVRHDIKNENQALLIAIAENSSDNRSNFTPIEEAKAFKRLIDLGYSKNEVAMECGVSRTKIAKSLKILALPEDIKDRFREGKMTASAAAAFVDLDDDERNIVIKHDDLTSKSQIDEILSKHRGGEAKTTSTSGTSKKKHTKGVFRGSRDVKNAAYNLYETYKNAADDDEMLIPYEWGLAALLFCMGETSVIDPEEKEFAEGLELLDAALEEMTGGGDDEETDTEYETEEDGEYEE